MDIKRVNSSPSSSQVTSSSSSITSRWCNNPTRLTRIRRMVMVLIWEATLSFCPSSNLSRCLKLIITRRHRRAWPLSLHRRRPPWLNKARRLNFPLASRNSSRRRSLALLVLLCSHKSARRIRSNRSRSSTQRLIWSCNQLNP